ncbi:hypothetical protein FGB62_55g059 [Gracilaria domingensis]|nr:hypothetical protein FGB62_55g059 [Gracilaria domingensis]
MNTKSSVIYGWVAYTVAFVVGGGIGIHRYWNGPGGRKEREAEAEKKRVEEAAREAEEEARIREERRLEKLEGNGAAIKD